MTVAPTLTFETPIQLLTERFPLILSDLSEWTRTNPDSARFTESPSKGLVIRQSRNVLLYDCPNPQLAMQQVFSAGPDRPLVHLFSTIAGFLHFLAQPHADQCLRHANWSPMILVSISNSRHARHWLAQTPASDWPWALFDRFAKTGYPSDAVKLFGLEMASVINAQANHLADELKSQYADRRSPGDVLATNDRPLRVLTLAYLGSSFQQFCARDICDGLNSNGVNARLLIPAITPAKEWELLKTIRDFDPDVLLLNGRSREECPGLPENLSVLSWDQDYMLSPRSTLAANLKPRDRVMVMLDEWRVDLADSGVPESVVRYVNIGTNTELYHPPEDAVEPDCDILFVGNIYPFENYRKMIGFDNLAEPMQQILLTARQDLTDWMLSRGEEEPFILPDVDQLLRDASSKIGLIHNGDAKHWRFLVNFFRYRVAHLLVRELIVNSLTEFKLALYGRGWDQFPLLAKFAKPELENGPPLRNAIHRAKINLHLHTWTVHHPRLYDTAAAGGFLLVGRVPEKNQLDGVFEIGSELDSFGCIAELKRKVQHYLDRPDERSAMAARAVQRVHRDHTMAARMKQAVEFLAEVK